jgi:1,4-alpha-glucan branching enzyme
MDNNLPVFLFHQGTNYNAYEYFGAHFIEKDGIKGVVFRIFAGRAKKVSVIGDFNFWNNNTNIMHKISVDGVFELFINGLKEFDNYKFCIFTKKQCLIKSDPFAFHSETHGKTASKIYELNGYNWNDYNYFENVKAKNIYESPINIYEVHFNSWKQYPDGNFYGYRKIADELIPYLKEMSYTHIEIMPITEYPFDGSWGYQVTGYFSITSRFGTPKDFMYFVDKCHGEGIGVIIDWVPAHFPKDEHGLYEFDGKPLYENSGWDRIEHKTWGTRRFDYGRCEVQSFLVSSAIFLFDKFHIDGLRVDAVASMLYLDYDKKEGEWLPNQYGDNKNLEAIEFLKKLNLTVFNKYPYALMIAEESTAWASITKPVHDGGLGFNFKWNMGWMNDILSYMQTDPYNRQYNHNKLTFSLTYAFSENYILPISHDEVVHGKKSLLDKMPGSYEEKFANLRAFMGFMYSHPGKKLNFMGNEFGQYKEWAFEEGLEFFLLKYPLHNKLYIMNKELNQIYKDNIILHQIDYSWNGFSWISADEADKNVISYKRIDRNGNQIIVLINFSGISITEYKLGLDKGKYKLIFNTDSKKYGGQGILNKKIFNTLKYFSHGREDSIELTIPKLSCLYFIKLD